MNSAIYSRHLTNRFHVAMCQFSNRSQMTSKHHKNKKKGGVHKAIAKCVTIVPDATGNKKETNVSVSLTSLQTLIEE